MTFERFFRSVVAYPRGTEVSVEPPQKESNEVVTAELLQKLKREGTIRPLPYEKLNKLGYKLLSRKRGHYYQIIPVNREITSWDRDKRFWEELKTDPFDRLHMYIRYLTMSKFKVYPCRVKFGKEIPLPAVTLQIGR